MKITILGKEREYSEGTTLLAISQDVAAEYAYPIMLALVNGKLRELRKQPKDGDEIEFVCDGIDEEQALKALVDAVESGLGE